MLAERTGALPLFSADTMAFMTANTYFLIALYCVSAQHCCSALPIRAGESHAFGRPLCVMTKRPQAHFILQESQGRQRQGRSGASAGSEGRGCCEWLIGTWPKPYRPLNFHCLDHTIRGMKCRGALCCQYERYRSQIAHKPGRGMVDSNGTSSGSLCVVSRDPELPAKYTSPPPGSRSPSHNVPFYWVNTHRNDTAGLRWPTDTAKTYFPSSSHALLAKTPLPWAPPSRTIPRPRRRSQRQKEHPMMAYDALATLGFDPRSSGL